MRQNRSIGVVIPARNEGGAIGKVVAAIPRWVDIVVVADNGSSDGTGGVAKGAGAIVVREEEPGYGAACLAGIARAGAVDILAFLDGDFSDYPEDLADIVDPIARGEVDIVIGSRVRGESERGSLTPQQRFGNWLATTLIHILWRTRYTDLGPFRAIDRRAYERLGMADRNYGWTVEMQIKAAEQKLRALEVPVRYRCRIGQSKVSGTIKGSVLAGYKILSIIGRHALRGKPSSRNTS